MRHSYSAFWYNRDLCEYYVLRYNFVNFCRRALIFAPKCAELLPLSITIASKYYWIFNAKNKIKIVSGVRLDPGSPFSINIFFSETVEDRLFLFFVCYSKQVLWQLQKISKLRSILGMFSDMSNTSGVQTDPRFPDKG